MSLPAWPEGAARLAAWHYRRGNPAPFTRLTRVLRGEELRRFLAAYYTLVQRKEEPSCSRSPR